uniref:Transcription factor CBF/NF-Y/archaeal histone domain-containing protein n=1 Tax=Anser cygnoides TaxID=8845 RepID=A0A8B9EAI7_ANSCY
VTPRAAAGYPPPTAEASSAWHARAVSQKVPWEQLTHVWSQTCSEETEVGLGELFVETIAKDAYVYAQQGKRKTLQRKDLDNAIEAIDEFAFLEGEFLLGFSWFQYFLDSPS